MRDALRRAASVAASDLDAEGSGRLRPDLAIDDQSAERLERGDGRIGSLN
jgi:hypothetical protein